MKRFDKIVRLIRGTAMFVKYPEDHRNKLEAPGLVVKDLICFKIMKRFETLFEK